MDNQRRKSPREDLVFRQKVSAFLRKEQERAGINQQEISKITGLSYGPLNRAFTGRAGISMENFFRICQALKVEKHDLINIITELNSMREPP